jgi:hypothetical protein
MFFESIKLVILTKTKMPGASQETGRTAATEDDTKKIRMDAGGVRSVHGAVQFCCKVLTGNELVLRYP